MQIPQTKVMNAHEIDYKIFGDDTQFIEIELDPQETVIAEAGSMLCMDPEIRMDTIFGDGSERPDGRKRGILDNLVGAGKRVITGESLFMTAFTHMGTGKKHVMFAAPYPGKIIPLDLSMLGGEMICQKDAFLCAAKGVSVGIAFQRKIMAGIFGGEGFILQKLEGNGMVFTHAGGSIIQRELKAGERLIVDTGCLVAFQPSVSYDVRAVSGIKSALFGGEGLFVAEVEGPGLIIIQSLPFSHLAAKIVRTSGHSAKSGGNNILENFSNIFEN